MDKSQKSLKAGKETSDQYFLCSLWYQRSLRGRDAGRSENKHS